MKNNSIWRRCLLAGSLGMALLIACSPEEDSRSPVAPSETAPGETAAKPTYQLAIDQGFLQDIYQAYASITEWKSVWVEQCVTNGDIAYVVPEGWDPAEPIALQIEGLAADPSLASGLLIRFPAGNQPFPYNAIFYDITLMSASHDIFMHPDPNRYTDAVIGSNYCSFKLVEHTPGTPYSYSDLWMSVPDPADPAPLQVRIRDGIHTLPDREAGVIIPGGSPPPADPDD